MQWNSGFQDSVFTFANNINTHEGGAHLSGFRAALSRTINAYARQKGLLKEKEESLTGDDIRGAGGGHLGQAAGAAVRGADQDQAREHRDQGPSRAPPTVSRRVPGGAPRRGQGDHQQGPAGREGAGRAEGEREDPQGLPGELDVAWQARRLLLEGPGQERALHRRGQLGRRIGQAGKERNFQAILPLRGKILNVEKANINKILSNAEIQALISAIGAGVGETFDSSRPATTRSSSWPTPTWTEVIFELWC